MATLDFGGQKIFCADGQSVLDALLTAGHEVPYSCKNGTCLTCQMRCHNGAVPEAAQVGIKDTFKVLGFFLPCVCVPTDDLELALPNEADVYGRVVVVGKAYLAPSICQLMLRPATPLYYRAGQFINLRRDDGLMRSYSLASVPHCDEYLQLHVKRLPRGAMSNWIFDDLSVGDSLEFQGPNGNCFYLPGNPDQNLLLIGNGSGLAPLIGIARDALHSGHRGEIRLYHGSRHLSGLYLGNELRRLADQFANFHYLPCTSGDPPPRGCHAGRVEIVALEQASDVANLRIFLCGYPPMVKAARKAFFLAGVDLTQIYADPFELQELRVTPRA